MPLYDVGLEILTGHDSIRIEHAYVETLRQANHGGEPLRGRAALKLFGCPGVWLRWLGTAAAWCLACMYGDRQP